MKNVTTSIFVTLQIEGLHCWANIPQTKEYDEVSYLKFPHRHTFGIRLEKNVSHEDRDIEIIKLKHEVEQWLIDGYFDSKYQCVDFGSMSCEMIASELLRAFGAAKVSVDEDGENGAVVTKTSKKSITNATTELVVSNRLLYGRNMIFICGRLCSGKSTLIDAFPTGESTITVEVSSLVKDILKRPKDASRESLQGHPEIDSQIILDLDGIRSNLDHHQMIVSGARQTSILEAFPLATVIWVDTPEQIRLQRFSKSSKDKGSMVNADAKDDELGLAEMKEYIFKRNS